MVDKLTLGFPAHFKYVRIASVLGVQAAQFIDSESDPEELLEFAHAFELAISEAVTNSVKHQRSLSRSSKIVVEIEISRTEMTVAVMDSNPHFDITQIPAPELDAHPENGYGIYIMRKIMDRVESRRENGWNILIMTKKRPGV